MIYARPVLYLMCKKVSCRLLGTLQYLHLSYLCQIFSSMQSCFSSCIPTPNQISCFLFVSHGRNKLSILSCSICPYQDSSSQGNQLRKTALFLQWWVEKKKYHLFSWMSKFKKIQRRVSFLSRCIRLANTRKNKRCKLKLWV